MDFERNIREDFSDTPVLLFCGGKGKRMENLAYKRILPSKEWLPIFDEYNKPVPLFWPIFEIFLELGLKEYYVIVRKEGEKIKGYFEGEFKDKSGSSRPVPGLPIPGGLREVFTAKAGVEQIIDYVAVIDSNTSRFAGEPGAKNGSRDSGGDEGNPEMGAGNQ